MRLGFKVSTLVLVVILLATTVAAAAPVAFDPGTGTADVAVMNTAVDTGTVTAEYINPSGSVERSLTKSVAGKGTVDFTAAESGLGDGWSGSMVLSSTSEIASVAQVHWTGGSSADGQTSGTYEGVSMGTTEAFCPSVFQRINAQYSVITVQNTDIGDVTIDMYYFDRNGNAYSGNPLTDVIPANAQRTYDLKTPGGKVPSLPVVNPPGDGWIGGMKIAARDGKKIAVVAATHWPDYSSIYDCLGAGATTLYFPDIKRRVFGGNWAQFGGNVVQNLSSTNTANLTTYWMDRNGNQLFTFTDTIPPLASHGYNTRYTSSNVPDHAALFLALGDDRNGA